LLRTALKEITLSWRNETPSSAAGYVIERKQNPQTAFVLLDSLIENKTEYVDKKVEQAQTYTYRVKAYNLSTDSDYSNEASLVVVGVKKEEGIPTEYSLSQNYPNPFNPTTKLKFALPKTVLTKLIIYDLLGREVETIINKELEAGYYEVEFNANQFSTGIYLYKIQAGDFLQTKKMILMK
jgi:hypothetical protein